VSVSNLTPGVYYYQVGDGNVWSEIKSFTVKAAPESVSFAVIGDLANSNAANADLIAGALLNSGIDYSFAIQTGNAISDVSSYDAWAHAAGVFGSFNGLDFIHTLGRGEQEAGSFYAAEELYRTYKIGNVFVSVINYTEDGAALEAALEDMVWDSKSSGTAWQILVINQAPVSTDPEKAESIASQLVPKMAERAGIDLVLSGDECRYARTESLCQGVVTQINGVTYVVTGSLGEKAEGAANGSFAVTKDDYNALYISVTVESDRLMVNVYDVLADGTVETVDSLVKTHHVCAEGEHLYRFAVNASYVICDYCDDHQFLGTYVGLVAYYDSFMYIKSNGFGSGWIEDNGKYYYFSPQTYQAVNGYRSINGYAYLFENYVLTEGCWIIKGNVRKLVWAGAYLTNTWHTQSGATYYFLSDGACATGEVEIPEINENGETVMIKYLFDEKGVLIGKVS
jgi:hypothetical protein